MSEIYTHFVIRLCPLKLCSTSGSCWLTPPEHWELASFLLLVEERKKGFFLNISRYAFEIATARTSGQDTLVFFFPQTGFSRESSVYCDKPNGSQMNSLYLAQAFNYSSYKQRLAQLLNKDQKILLICQQNRASERNLCWQVGWLIVFACIEKAEADRTAKNSHWLRTHQAFTDLRPISWSLAIAIVFVLNAQWNKISVSCM